MVDGKRKRPHLFRVVLSHSRKGYSEVVWRQTTENFIRCLENGYRHFGGVPKNTVIDNLRAAVTRADWYDPEINPKVAEFCRHYGTVMMPTRPARSWIVSCTTPRPSPSLAGATGSKITPPLLGKRIKAERPNPSRTNLWPQNRRYGSAPGPRRVALGLGRNIS